MTSEPIMEGGCGCGAVRYRVTGAPKWASHCHCVDCRRAAGAAYVTYVGLQTAQVAWSGTPPARHQSSPGVTRTFCGKCGTSLTYEGERWPGEIHIARASVPGAIDREPQAHVFYDLRVAWLEPHDDIRKLGGPQGNQPLPLSG